MDDLDKKKKDNMGFTSQSDNNFTIQKLMEHFFFF